MTLTWEATVLPSTTWYLEQLACSLVAYVRHCGWTAAPSVLGWGGRPRAAGAPDPEQRVWAQDGEGWAAVSFMAAASWACCSLYFLIFLWRL